MNRKAGLALCIFGGIVALLGIGLSQMGIAAAKPSVLSAIIGGGICVLWGILALKGNGQRALAMITLVVMSLVFLAQSVNGWFGEKDFAGKPGGAALITFMLLISTAILMVVAHAGDTEARLENDSRAENGHGSKQPPSPRLGAKKSEA